MKLLPLLLFLLCACDPFNTTFDDTEDAVSYKSTTIVAPMANDTVKIMDWNVKFGGGRIDFFFDCYGKRVLMLRAEVIANLNNTLYIDGLKTITKYTGV